MPSINKVQRSGAAGPENEVVLSTARIRLLKMNPISAVKDGRAYLGPDYTVNNYDIVCGRGKFALNNIGNRRFRITISLHLDQYVCSKTRAEKTARVALINQIIRSAGGRFLKREKNTQEWYDIGDEMAAAKIGHALRDADKEMRRQKPRDEAPLSRAKRPRPKDKLVEGWDNLLDDTSCYLHTTDDGTSGDHVLAVDLSQKETYLLDELGQLPGNEPNSKDFSIESLAHSLVDTAFKAASSGYRDENSE